MTATSRKLKPSVAAALVLGSLAFGLGIAEASLRVAGFSSQVLPTLQFGWPVAKVLVNQYKPDHDLFWVTNDYEEKLVASRAHPPAVIFLGDSCTEWGEYPALTLQRLMDGQSSLGTGVKLGTAGWSSVQGLTQLRRDVVPLNPRVVTIYFGWNDHWRALGPADAEARLTDVGWWLSQHTRFYQLWMKARLVAAPNDLAKRPIRVPLDLYEANLRDMARLVRDHGGMPVLITAPSGHEPGKEPRYLLQQHVSHLSELIPLHMRYVEATRRAAAATGSILCDAARTFESLPEPKGLYFQKDGIHLSAEGDAALATALAACIINGEQRVLARGF